VNLNSATTDNNVTMASTKYIVDRILVFDPSAAVTTASVGLFGAAGGGAPTISADATLSAALTATTKFKSLTLAASATADVYTAATLFFRVGTAEGSARTASVMIFGFDLS
jgi:hypothetical protein